MKVGVFEIFFIYLSALERNVGAELRIINKKIMTYRNISSCFRFKVFTGRNVKSSKRKYIILFQFLLYKKIEWYCDVCDKMKK